MKRPLEKKSGIVKKPINFCARRPLLEKKKKTREKVLEKAH